MPSFSTYQYFTGNLLLSFQVGDEGPGFPLHEMFNLQRQPDSKVVGQTGPILRSSVDPATDHGSMSNPSPTMSTSRGSRCNSGRHWTDQLLTSPLTLPPIACVTGCATIPDQATYPAQRPGTKNCSLNTILDHMGRTDCH